MNMRELLEWKENKKKANAKKYLKDIQENGECKSLTQNEYNQITHKQKSSTTRRTHSRGNLWNHTNLPKEKVEIVVAGKLLKY